MLQHMPQRYDVVAGISQLEMEKITDGRIEPPLPGISRSAYADLSGVNFEALLGVAQEKAVTGTYIEQVSRAFSFFQQVEPLAPEPVADVKLVLPSRIGYTCIIRTNDCGVSRTRISKENTTDLTFANVRLEAQGKRLAVAQRTIDNFLLVTK